MIPSKPSRTSTLWISSRAAAFANQWKLWEAITTSMLASGRPKQEVTKERQSLVCQNDRMIFYVTPYLVLGGGESAGADNFITSRGVNLNYRSRAFAKGLLRTISCGMVIWNVFYRKMMNCFREKTFLETIVIARAGLVPVPNRASDFGSLKLWVKKVCFQFFKWIRDNMAFLII